MWSFGAFCDEYSVASRLSLKLDLAPSRESLLHFFEQLRRIFPALSRMRTREDGGLLLDEDEDRQADRRFLRLDSSAIKFGVHNPSGGAAVMQFADAVLAHAPAHLTLSDLDLDFIETVFSFDFEYRGNHDELIAEALLAGHPLLAAVADDESRIIECQPMVGVSLGPDCERQLYVELKGRTSTFEVRTGEYDASPLSVFLTVRQYITARSGAGLEPIHRELIRQAQAVAAQRVVPHILQPLAAAIASRR